MPESDSFENFGLSPYPDGSRGAVMPPNSVPTGERSNTSEPFALGAMPHVTELPEYTQRSRDIAIEAMRNASSEAKMGRVVVRGVGLLPVSKAGTIEHFERSRAIRLEREKAQKTKPRP